MKSTEEIAGYRCGDAEVNVSHAYLLPALREELAKPAARDKRLFDLGCGNGSVGALLHHRDGWQVAGVDPSAEGIARAKARHPELRLEIGSAYHDPGAACGRFPAAISFEVVEHVNALRDDARTLAKSMISIAREPG